MPDKEGSDDEKKSTKSVVNKKQRQMMGEEEYDTYRDNILMRGGDHRSKETKERSYTPSKESKGKTAAQKAAKGKSALELVKASITKKYGKGAIMDVGKKKVNEELDLTQVAESFGGYIIEVKITGDKSGNITGVETTAAEKAAAKKAQEKQKEIFRKAATKKPKKAEAKVPTKPRPKKTLDTMAQNIAQDDIEKSGQTFKQPVSGTSQAKGYKPKPGSVKLKPFAGTVDKKTGKVTEPPVKVSKVDPKTLEKNPRGDQTPKPSKSKPKSKPKPKPVVSPEKEFADAGADALKDMQKDTKVIGDIMPATKREVKQAEKESRPKLSKFSGPQMTAAQKSKRFSQRMGDATGADPQTGRPTYIKPGVSTGKPRKAETTKKSLDLDRVREKISKKEPKVFLGKRITRKGLKGVMQKVRQTKKVTKKTAKDVGKGMVRQTKAFGRYAKANPFAAAVVGTEVLDRVVRAIPKPRPPKLDAGVVGRRSAG